jgi:hypothetical protein
VALLGENAVLNPKIEFSDFRCFRLFRCFSSPFLQQPALVQKSILMPSRIVRGRSVLVGVRKLEAFAGVKSTYSAPKLNTVELSGLKTSVTGVIRRDSDTRIRRDNRALRACCHGPLPAFRARLPVLPIRGSENAACTPLFKAVPGLCHLIDSSWPSN